MSNSIWKKPDQKPDVFKPHTIMVVYEAHDEAELMLSTQYEAYTADRYINRWCYLDELLAQANKAERLQKEIDIGECSDGYHTFNELYYHRMCLFSIIVKQNKNLAWKSKLHSDGTMFDNYFIVGIDTPNGQATYHYHIDHWDMFDCVELPNAPEWDGHTADDALKRLLSLTKSNN